MQTLLLTALVIEFVLLLLILFLANRQDNKNKKEIEYWREAYHRQTKQNEHLEEEFDIYQT